MSFTATQQPGDDRPGIYPNPSDGTQPVSVHIPGRDANTAVRVQIFTVAFRLVQDWLFPPGLYGTEVPIDLKDRTGKPLASGFYYVVVNMNGKRTVGKLLLIR
jgi:hypothetical protein